MSVPALRVTCWCERDTGLVSLDDIREGRTFSCGLWWCRDNIGHLRLLRRLRSAA